MERYGLQGSVANRPIPKVAPDVQQPVSPQPEPKLAENKVIEQLPVQEANVDSKPKRKRTRRRKKSPVTAAVAEGKTVSPTTDQGETVIHIRR
jgi:hypothetical protein